MNDLLQRMKNEHPACHTKAKKEKGHYGKPHLVLLRDERFHADEVQLKILIPYSETYRDEEDGNKKKMWLNWVDFNGNTFNEFDDLKPRKWLLLSEVDTQVLELLQLVPPTDEQWKKAMT